MITIKPSVGRHIPLSAPKIKQLPSQSPTENLPVGLAEKTTAPVKTTRQPSMIRLESEWKKVTNRPDVYYEIPKEPTYYTIKSISKGNHNRPVTTYYTTHPAGNAAGDKLKKILTPEEYDMALMATAEAYYDGLAQEVAALLHELEPELTTQQPTQVEESGLRNNYKNSDIKWADVSPVTKDAIQGNKAITYTPRKDFLKVAITAKENLKYLVEMASSFEGAERAQLLKNVATNGDWSEIRHNLRTISDIAPKPALLDHNVELKKNALIPIDPGASYLPLNSKIKSAYEHPNYVAPSYQTRV